MLYSTWAHNPQIKYLGEGIHSTERITDKTVGTLVGGIFIGRITENKLGTLAGGIFSRRITENKLGTLVLEFSDLRITENN